MRASDASIHQATCYSCGNYSKTSLASDLRTGRLHGKQGIIEAHGDVCPALAMLFVAQANICGRLLAQGVPSPSYWSLQFTNWPPTPFNPFPNAATFLLDSNNIAYDDRDVSYPQSGAQWQAQSSEFMSLGEPPPEPGGGGSGPDPGVPSVQAYGYGTNVLWIEIYAVTNDLAYLTLHNTKSNKWYQLLSKPTLDPGYWKPGQVIFNDAGTNQIYFDPVPTEGLTNTFYRGAEGNWKVRIIPDGHAYEPNTPQGLSGVSAQFLIYSDVVMTNALPVVYLIGGSAQNGTDYVTISSPATIPANSDETNVPIVPYEDSLVEFDENVILRLVVTNGYVVEPTQSKATVLVSDNPGTNELFTIVATNLVYPAGIDYHPTNQSLIVSTEFFQTPNYNFFRISSNGVVTNWSGITNQNEEKKIGVIKTSTNGFVAGETFFGVDVDGVIGKISADGTVTNLNWVTLTNSIQPTLFRGGFHQDGTGIFGYDLIAVTGGASNQGGEIWRITSSGIATLLAHATNIDQRHLEGVVTLTNDVSKWGPWAGKILTGAESQTPPLIFAVDTNGVVSSFALGIEPEDFDVIPVNQDLYLTAYNEGMILKLSKSFLTNYVGDMLITQEGPNSLLTRLYIVHWDPVQSDFTVRTILPPWWASQGFEHSTFAPISLPKVRDP